MTKRAGRGRLSAIDLLPPECDELISWAAQQLGMRSRSQLDIYAEWKQKLIALQGETGVGFDIPSFSSFNRYSVKLADITRRLEQTREIAGALSERFDPATSDHLTLVATEAIKSLVFELLQAVLPVGFMQQAIELLKRAGLGNETKNIAFVHRFGGNMKVTFTGQHHAHAFWRQCNGSGKKSDAIHARHIEIGNDNGKRAMLFDSPQSFFTAQSGYQLPVFAQPAAVRVNDIGFVVNKENFWLHQAVSLLLSR